METLSREVVFLDFLERRTKRWIGLGPVVAVVGALLLVGQWLGDVGNVVGGAGVIIGPVFVWLGLAWSKLIPACRESLKASPLDVRLEVKVHRGYAFRRYTTAQLWPFDSASSPVLAQFGAMNWPEPRYLAVNKVPARVYGAPTLGAKVVVCCPEGILVGRIRWSRFGDDRPPRSVPPIMKWLTKERTLRSP